jgi:tRNA modification GTPase
MEDRAIVTEMPGTTRDVLRASIVLSGVTVILNDTAGIQDSKDAVEKLGIQRAKQEMETADLLIIVLDGAGPLSREARQILKENANRSRIVLQSKVDINRTPYYDGALLFSSYTGEGMDDIRAAIIANINGVQDSELTLSRHVDLAKKSAQALISAKQAFIDGDSADLCAVHVQDALHLLGEITGDSVSEEVIDSIFSNFCVGK